MTRSFVLKRKRVYVMLDGDKIEDGFVQCSSQHPHVVIRSKPTWCVKKMIGAYQQAAQHEILKQADQKLLDHFLNIRDMAKVNAESRDAATKAMLDDGYTMADLTANSVETDRIRADADMIKTAMLIHSLGGDWGLYPEDVDPSTFPKMGYTLSYENSDRIQEDLSKRIKFLHGLIGEDIAEIDALLGGVVDLTDAEVKN